MMYSYDELIYENALANPDDVKDFRIEGDAAVTFPRGRLRLENKFERDMDKNYHANFLFWCPEEFPDNIAVTWDFQPKSDAGLAMFWIASKGMNGEDLFDPSLKQRDGSYNQYHSGDINAYHISYFRRNPKEINFQTCNLRKSNGFHLLCQGADPLPDSANALPSYQIKAIKYKAHIRFEINDILIFDYEDDGTTYGPVWGSGKIGFRQMAGLIAEYANLKVYKVKQSDS